MKRTIIVILFLFSLPVFSQTDTLISSVNLITGYNDSASNFFHRNEKLNEAQWADTKLTMRTRKTTTLKAILSDPERRLPEHVIADLDNDGKKELVISSHTGGAHCCDEISIYREAAPGKYAHAVTAFAGHSLFTDDGEIVYTLYEPFGYFFTCYACGLTDTSDAAPIDIRAIVLKYNKGKLQVKRGDPELKSAILDNLGKLSEMPYEKLDEESGMDNGLRKEFAMNLAVYYFSFGKRLNDTKALFNKYYDFPDAAKVWSAFTRDLRAMQAGNDF